MCGTCAVGRQAIGTAAALLCASDKYDVRDIEIDRLQQLLLKDDCYLPKLANSDEKDLARSCTIKASSEEAGYPASNIINGVARAIDGECNQWRSKENEAEGFIEMQLRKRANVQTVQLTFDSNFDIEKKITMSSTRQNQQVPGIPKELIRDYNIVFLLNGKEVSCKEIRGNFQRVNRISFEPVLCDCVRIDILSTNGDLSAKIFEVRIYE